MFPVLVSIGPVVIRTFSVLLVLAFFIAAFVFWRKGKEEYYAEDQLFDGFLLSAIVGFIAARIGFVVFHIETIGWNVLDWFNFIGVPGMSGMVGLIFAGAYMYHFAREKKWDPFEVMDFWAMSASIGLALVSLGAFFDGIGFGFPTTLPWGVLFPGLLEPHHPVQLYAAVCYGIVFWLLSWAEYRYRTFRWYRATKKAAETGFLLCMFIISAAFFSLVLSFMKPATFEVFTVNVDQVASIVFLVAGVLLLYVRSGRTIGWKTKKKRLFA
jgi:phosphatidylglycerol:prolipoprotein diacylglycerol transferase